MRAWLQSYKIEIEVSSTTRLRGSRTANKPKYLSNISARRMDPHAPVRHEVEVNRPRRANEMHHKATLDAEPQEVQNQWGEAPKECEISSTTSTTP